MQTNGCRESNHAYGSTFLIYRDGIGFDPHDYQLDYLE